MSKRSEHKQWKRRQVIEHKARNAAPTALAHEKRQKALREAESWLKKALHRDNLRGYTPWQMNFLKSIEAQVTRGWPLTPKQRHCLTRIYPITHKRPTRTGQAPVIRRETGLTVRQNPIRGPKQR